MAKVEPSGVQRVVVVTGGGAGIGAAIAEELGRTGAFVVTMDPMVTVDGASRMPAPEETTAQRIIDAGGSAMASSTSVTDAEGVQALFAQLVQDHGRLDAVVNVAGISRPTDFAAGLEDDWEAVLSVHLEGYLNVLRAALPIMAAAGHGRILGVTSGSGWRAANTGAYGCAKRAVAALTWQIGQVPPDGVTVNALSPIAATRMVTGALGRPQGPAGPGSAASTGGLSLASMPKPESLGPVGAYLASEDFSWCSGRIIFSGGSEAAVISAPRLLEVARSGEVTSVAHALDAIVPLAFLPAEAAQQTNGGTNPRFGGAFEEPGEEPGDEVDRRAGPVQRCVVVTDDERWGARVSQVLAARSITCTGLGPWSGSAPSADKLAEGFAACADQLAAIAEEAGPVDAVVLALRGVSRGEGGVGRGGPNWEAILREHEGLAAQVRADAGWVRAVSDLATRSARPVRVVTVTDATTSGGRSRAQAAAQLARAGHVATSDRVHAFAISVESGDDADQGPIAELVAHLLCGANTENLSGAELVAGPGWVGLRSHPAPTGSISYGGPALPGWFDQVLRTMVTGRAAVATDPIQ